MAWFEKVNKITFFGVYSKIAEKRIFLIFVDSDLNLCKASQVRAFSPRARASLHGSLWKFGWWSSTILKTQVWNFIKIWASVLEIFAKQYRLSEYIFNVFSIFSQFHNLFYFGHISVKFCSNSMILDIFQQPRRWAIQKCPRF